MCSRLLCDQERRLATWVALLWCAHGFYVTRKGVWQHGWLLCCDVLTAFMWPGKVFGNMGGYFVVMCSLPLCDQERRLATWVATLLWCAHGLYVTRKGVWQHWWLCCDVLTAFMWPGKAFGNMGGFVVMCSRLLCDQERRLATWVALLWCAHGFYVTRKGVWQHGWLCCDVLTAFMWPGKAFGNMGGFVVMCSRLLCDQERRLATWVALLWCAHGFYVTRKGVWQHGWLLCCDVLMAFMWPGQAFGNMGGFVVMCSRLLCDQERRLATWVALLWCAHGFYVTRKGVWQHEWLCCDVLTAFMWPGKAFGNMGGFVVMCSRLLCDQERRLATWVALLWCAHGFYVTRKGVWQHGWLHCRIFQPGRHDPQLWRRIHFYDSPAPDCFGRVPSLDQGRLIVVDVSDMLWLFFLPNIGSWRSFPWFFFIRLSQYNA